VQSGEQSLRSKSAYHGDEKDQEPASKTVIADEETEKIITSLGCGCSLDFNPLNHHIFLVGTEEGEIQAFSKAYNPQFLKAFSAHAMPVYTVQWNPFHPHVFLSCSADWTVRVWDTSERGATPALTFELNSSVSDVAWAPYSSTVFAAITSDGIVRMFDIQQSKHAPIGELRIARRSKLTHISFNPHEPIVCVGDDKGVVSILKLARTMRLMSAPSVEQLDVATEVSKLKNLLIINDCDSTSQLYIPLPEKKLPKKPENKQRQRSAGVAVVDSSRELKSGRPKSGSIGPSRISTARPISAALK